MPEFSESGISYFQGGGNFVSFHFFSFPFISFHFLFISFHFLFISFHFLSFSFHFLSFSFHFPFLSFHFLSFSFHFLSFPFISFHFPFISFHFPCILSELPKVHADQGPDFEKYLICVVVDSSYTFVRREFMHTAISFIMIHVFHYEMKNTHSHSPCALLTWSAGRFATLLG